MSAISARSQIVKRLEDTVPELGRVQGFVALEAAFQGEIKHDTAFVYRLATDKIDVGHPQQQIILATFGIALATKNIKDTGGDESDDINEALCRAVNESLLGWIPPGAQFPLQYVKGQPSFARNLLIWTEIYSLKQIITNLGIQRRPL